jgi:hypothetical protein
LFFFTVEAKNTDSTTEIGTFKKQIDDLTKQLEKSDSGDLTQFKDLNKKVRIKERGLYT